MPCLTLSATHAYRRLGATASAFITATLTPCFQCSYRNDGRYAALCLKHGEEAKPRSRATSGGEQQQHLFTVPAGQPQLRELCWRPTSRRGPAHAARGASS